MVTEQFIYADDYQIVRWQVGISITANNIQEGILLPA